MGTSSIDAQDQCNRGWQPVGCGLLATGQAAPGPRPGATLPPRLHPTRHRETAFWPMFKSAIGWSGDVEVLKLAPKDVPGFKNDQGNAAMWEATFASPRKHQVRVYTYSIAAVPPDILKGIEAGFPEPWAGETSDAMPIDLSGFNIDSDAAYKAAAAAATGWLAKNPGKAPTSLELGSTFALHAPVWYVAWGDKRNGYVALVNATTGELFQKR